MVFRKRCFNGCLRFDLQISVATGPKFTVIFFTESGRNRGRSDTCPILNILIRSKNIRRRSLKSSEIAPNFCMFLARNFLVGEGSPKFWTGNIKFGVVRSVCKISRRSDDAARRYHGEIKNNTCSKT